jgi:hypothetical protein
LHNAIINPRGESSFFQGVLKVCQPSVSRSLTSPRSYSRSYWRFRQYQSSCFGIDRDGAEYEAIFETDEQSVGKTVDKVKAEEIAMAWMQVFYGEQVGTMESRELKTTLVTHWLFRLTVDDPVERMYFVVLLPDEMVVVPRAAAR